MIQIRHENGQPGKCQCGRITSDALSTWVLNKLYYLEATGRKGLGVALSLPFAAKLNFSNCDRMIAQK